MDAILTQPTPPTVKLLCMVCGYETDVAPGELVTRIAEHTHGEPEEPEKTEPEEEPEEQEAPSIEELLRTPAPFRAWLERMSRGYGRDFVIGEACASFACPLNQFLADETGRDRLTIEVSIAPPVVQLWRLDDAQESAEEDGAAIPLPAWASALVRQVDLYPIGRKVVVDELLFLLDYVEQHLAVEGVLP